MAGARRKFDEDSKQGAVRLVRETGKPIAQVARELGISEGTLGNWCAQELRRHGEGALTGSERNSCAGYARRTPSCGCDVTCSSAAALWLSG